MNYEIWDLHCHLSGVPGKTPAERLAKHLEYDPGAMSREPATLVLTKTDLLMEVGFIGKVD
jgi:hypothetical protein